MNAIKLIAKHLPADISKIKLVDCDDICAVTGEQLSKGVFKKDLTTGTFNDWEIFRFDSKFVSFDVVKCLAEVIKGNSKLNSLRNYSYFASENEFRLLKREDFWNLLLNIPEPPFVIAYSFNSKKHTSTKARITVSKDNIKLITDIYDTITLSEKSLKILMPIVQNWYSATKDMSKTDTFFTKEEIIYGSDNYKKAERYGLGRYITDNTMLSKYRNTSILVLLTRLVNRCELN